MAVSTAALLLGAGANAQPDCVQQFKPWEPQRRTLLFLKSQIDRSALLVHVAGRVATNLMFPTAVDRAGTTLRDEDGRFEPLMIDARSLVIVPSHDLAPDEHFSFTVKLKDGTQIPFVLVPPRLHQGSDGQVDVFVDQESSEDLQKSLQSVRVQVEALTLQNQRHVEEGASIEHALATLLAQGQTEFTPFTEAGVKVEQDKGVSLKVITFRRRDQTVKLGKTAVVFSVTNKDADRSWDLDEVRLTTLTTTSAKPFAMRASAMSIAPGETGRVAIVFDMKAFESKSQMEHLVLELWRSGGHRQALVELVAVDDRNMPVKIGRGSRSR